MASKAAPLSPTPATGDQQIVFVVDGVTEAPVSLFGWSLAEHTGSAAAKVILYDGHSTSAPELAVIDLAQGASSNVDDANLEVQSGAVYLNVLSGSVEGTILWG